MRNTTLTTVIAVLLFTTIAASAAAQPSPLIAPSHDHESFIVPMTIYFTMAGLDVMTTAGALERGTATEADPLVNWARPLGVWPMLAIGESIDVMTVLLMRHWLGSKDPNLFRFGLYAGAIGRGMAVTINVTVSP
jgi:hypothetical protein